MQVTQCDVCKATGAPKATHRLKADDDRFTVDIEVSTLTEGLDLCSACWWKFVRQALKDSE
ncbi:hypothetical protein LCGC14_0587870 [marine sediment metagenome]|uniref:Uncharacterized protein n=1 Tax=marine sediment metagenome TaxID=412755 RepID=A0A0F9RJH2_9ZZZZ